MAVRRLLGCAIILATALAAHAQSRTFRAEGAERRFLLHVPQDVKHPPLLVLLHGYGGRPEDLFSGWKRLADENEFAVVALKSAGAGWTRQQDGVAAFDALLAAVAAEVSFDPRRVYLYGYSNGGRHAVRMALLMSRRIAAAVAVAAFTEPVTQLGIAFERKVPLLLMSAEKDTLAPPLAIRTTADTLRKAGLEVHHVELLGIGHNYFAAARQVHRRAWDYLRAHRLPQQ